MIFFYKILNRLNLLKYINVISKITIGDNHFKIPIIHGLGLDNLNHRSSWIEDLLSKFEGESSLIVILDIGVNVGQTLLSVKSLNSNWDYIGFEPNANCVYYVNELIKANKFKNTTIMPIAISDKIDTLDLYFNEKTDSTATILESFRPNHYKNGFKERILCFDLDSLIQKYLKLDKIDILKIDIEGSEVLALKGARSIIELYKPIIICEVLDTHASETLKNHKLNLQAIETLLKELNYNMYQIHRNEDDSKITELRRIEKFEIKIWDIESLKLNDYLFVSNKNADFLKIKSNLKD